MRAVLVDHFSSSPKSVRKSIILLVEAVDNGGGHLDNVPPSGGVPEWPKGSDCKSDAKASVVRIHPPPPLVGNGYNAPPLGGSYKDLCSLRVR